MNTQQVAEKLVAMCREGKNMEALNELYADNCTSREMPGMPNEFVEGKSAITKSPRTGMRLSKSFTAAKSAIH